MTSRLPVFVVLLAVMAATPMLAAAQQTGTVSGTLTDSVSGQPVADAIVVVDAPGVTRQAKSALRN
jgi:hypothetical protein